ncbi:MAG: anti-sigma factor [Gammaproteobacteria bacterium]
MNDRDARVTEQDLHAYVDDQLDQARRAEIEAYLQMTPAEAAKVRDYQRINQALQTLHQGVLAEAIPRRLRRQSKPVRRRRAGWQAAMVAGWLLCGGVIGWWLRAQWPMPLPPFRDALVQEALQAHAVYLPEVRHPVEVPAEQEKHLVAWLSKRLAASIQAPKLTAAGFELLGGRLLPAGDGPAAQFMYQNAQGQRLTLFVRKDVKGSPDTAFQFAEKNQLNAFYWIDQDLGYALIGDVERDILTQLATSVYQQLTY